MTKKELRKMKNLVDPAEIKRLKALQKDLDARGYKLVLVPADQATSTEEGKRRALEFDIVPKEVGVKS